MDPSRVRSEFNATSRIPSSAGQSSRAQQAQERAVPAYSQDAATSNRGFDGEPGYEYVESGTYGHVETHATHLSQPTPGHWAPPPIQPTPVHWAPQPVQVPVQPIPVQPILAHPAPVHPLPIQTGQPIGRQPSFKVSAQPARPHKAQTIRREPSFRVQPQSPIGVVTPDTGHGQTFQDISHQATALWQLLQQAEARRQEEIRLEAIRTEEMRRQTLQEEERQAAIRAEDIRRHALREETRRHALLEIEETPYREACREDKAQRQAILAREEVLRREEAQQQARRQSAASEEAFREKAVQWQTLQRAELQRQALSAEQACQEALRAEERRLQTLRQEEFLADVHSEEIRRQARREDTRRCALLEPPQESSSREAARQDKVTHQALVARQEFLRREEARREAVQDEARQQVASLRALESPRGHLRPEQVDQPVHLQEEEDEDEEELVQQHLEFEQDDSPATTTDAVLDAVVPFEAPRLIPSPLSHLPEPSCRSTESSRHPLEPAHPLPVPSPTSPSQHSPVDLKSHLPSSPEPLSPSMPRGDSPEAPSVLREDSPALDSFFPSPEVFDSRPPPHKTARHVPLSFSSTDLPPTPDPTPRKPTVPTQSPRTDRPPCAPTPHPSSSPTEEYRVPSPTFDRTKSPASVNENVSAQFLALLLRQGEQMTGLMQQLVTSNQELRSSLNEQFSTLAERLLAIETKSTDHAKADPAVEDDLEEEEGDLQDSTGGPGKADDGEADDELELGPTARSRRRKVQKTSVLSDPSLKDGMTALQACVREHLFTLCDVECTPDLWKKNPPISKEEMDSFNEGEDDLLTCSVQSFRVDFVRPWKGKDSAFNCLAKNVFVRSLIKMYRGGEYSDHVVPDKLLTEKTVGVVLDKHMEYRRKQYRQQLKPLSKEDRDKISKRKAMNARKHTLKDSRVSIILEMKLYWHKRLFSMLRPVHMSGDETDGSDKTHPPTFLIVNARWQSLLFRLFLRTLDALYRESWATPVGDRATSGNPPRVRIEREDCRSEDSLAPIGLWRNCYDQDWLKSLRPHVRASLKIIDADYDFKLPALKPVQK
ncbi:hypothetical protein TRAPUB_7 [Trametes pubescens]|uniref:Uncharacterized protein n=1 Tax=Trametes pubescens TaxID=154538 RepID=A0A1M2VND1_TRAPU|nr:hypothetical protein TRAPUB_7 [Trametes pubescens]